MQIYVVILYLFNRKYINLDVNLIALERFPIHAYTDGPLPTTKTPDYCNWQYPVYTHPGNAVTSVFLLESEIDFIHVPKQHLSLYILF